MKTLQTNNFCWLFQQTVDEPINFVKEIERELSNYKINATFDLAFHITDIYSNRADLENRLQILANEQINYINEDDMVISLFYRSHWPDEDMLLKLIQSTIIENKIKIIFYKKFK